MLTGMSLDAARALAPRDVTAALERLPRNKEHCSILAIDALRAALAEIDRRVV
jgi:NifU-like protein involved in Fe-S cluster formation